MICSFSYPSSHFCAYPSHASVPDLALMMFPCNVCLQQRGCYAGTWLESVNVNNMVQLHIFFLYLIKYFKCILTDATLSITGFLKKDITGKSGSPDVRIDLLSTFQSCLLVHGVRTPTILHHALIVQMRAVTTNSITEISLMQVGLFPQFHSYTGIWNVHISDIVWYHTFSLHVLIKDLKKIPEWPCIKHPCQ